MTLRTLLIVAALLALTGVKAGAAPPGAPTSNGIADVQVLPDSADSVIDLFAAFDDVDDPDEDLTYTIEANSNPALFTSTVIDGVAGTLTLDFAPATTGAASITVRATDPGLQFAEASFSVTVNTAPTLSVVAQDYRVLLIGNSYAYYPSTDTNASSLLSYLHSMVTEAPDASLTTDYRLVGGQDMKGHWDQAIALSKIQSFNPDYVILQGQSMEALHLPAQYNIDYELGGRPSFLDYAYQFLDEIEGVGARGIMFVTWPRRTGHEFYSYLDPGLDPDTPWSGGAMRPWMEMCKAGYQMTTPGHDAALALIGEAWMTAITDDNPGLPGIEGRMFNSDKSHPTATGTYLSTCVLFELIYKRSCQGLTFLPAGVNPLDRDYLQEVATATTGVPLVGNQTGVLSLGAIVEDDVTNDGDTVTRVLASGGGDRVSDPDAGALEGIAVTDVDNTHGTWQYSIDSGNNWNDFGAPTDSAARLLSADNAMRVRFVPDADWNGFVAEGLTFRAWDTTSGLAGDTADTTSNGGATAFSSATQTISIQVNPYNDAPVLDAGGAFTINGLVEDDANPPGTSVLDLITNAGGDRITDVDDTAIEGIAVIDADDTNGTWQFTRDSGATWTDFNSPGVGTARLLAADIITQVRFVPDADFDGNATMTFRAWDRTDHGNTETADTTTNGGASPFSTVTATISVQIVAINDAPQALNVNQAHGWTQGDAIVPITPIDVSDVDTGEVITATLTLADPAAGTLTANAGASYNPGTGEWTISGSVAQVNAALAVLAFLPDAEGDTGTSIDVHIADGGENGASAVTGTITLTIGPTLLLTTAAPDPWNASPFQVTATFNTAVTDFTLADIRVSAGIASNLAGGPTVYTFDVTPTNAKGGYLTVSVPPGAALDGALLGNSASNWLYRVIDGTRPVVSVTFGKALVSTTGPWKLSIRSNEPLIGLTLGDLTLVNAVATNLRGGPQVFLIDLTITAPGVASVSIADSAASDGAGNPSLASNELQVTYTDDPDLVDAIVNATRVLDKAQKFRSARVLRVGKYVTACEREETRLNRDIKGLEDDATRISNAITALLDADAQLSATGFGAGDERRVAIADELPLLADMLLVSQNLRLILQIESCEIDQWKDYLQALQPLADQVDSGLPLTGADETAIDAAITELELLLADWAG